MTLLINLSFLPPAALALKITAKLNFLFIF
jgi:hypothetical protein